MFQVYEYLNTLSFKTKWIDLKGLVLTRRNVPLINIVVFNACTQASLQDYWGQFYNSHIAENPDYPVT